eukprot:12893452-Prorocentrum_lima.AAC.1
MEHEARVMRDETLQAEKLAHHEEARRARTIQEARSAFHQKEEAMASEAKEREARDLAIAQRINVLEQE